VTLVQDDNTHIVVWALNEIAFEPGIRVQAVIESGIIDKILFLMQIPDQD
jgi:hypothetical protein